MTPPRLSFDKHRLDHFAAVVSDDVTRDVHPVSADIDLDFGEVRAAGESGLTRFKIDGFSQTWCNATRHRKAGRAGEPGRHGTTRQ